MIHVADSVDSNGSTGHAERCSFRIAGFKVMSSKRFEKYEHRYSRAILIRAYDLHVIRGTL
jgi:hypothetical protein